MVLKVSGPQVRRRYLTTTTGAASATTTTGAPGQAVLTATAGEIADADITHDSITLRWDRTECRWL